MQLLNVLDAQGLGPREARQLTSSQWDSVRRGCHPSSINALRHHLNSGGVPCSVQGIAERNSRVLCIRSFLELDTTKLTTTKLGYSTSALVPATLACNVRSNIDPKAGNPECSIVKHKASCAQRQHQRTNPVIFIDFLPPISTNRQPIFMVQPSPNFTVQEWRIGMTEYEACQRWQDGTNIPLSSQN